MGRTPAIAPSARDDAAPAPGPLAGLRVVDLTTVMMGPYAGQILADMGADVVKVETPEGDALRGIGPARNPGMGPIFLQANRGKRSLVLDLKTEGGKAAYLELVRRADIVVTSVRPRALARLGLDYEALKAVKPDLVFLALVGYGQGGPYAARPAYDDLMQGAAGLPRLAEAAGASEPRYVPVAIADRFVGVHGVGAVLAALWARDRTGRGTLVEVPMFETMAQLVLGDHMGGRLFDPPIGPAGYPRLLSKDRRPYPTRDGHVCALVYNDEQWRRFFAALGREDAFRADPRFATIAARTAHIDEIYAMMAGIMAERSTEECIALLESADIPVMPLHTLDSLMDDPHLLATGYFQAVEHPSEGALRMPSAPARFTTDAAGGPGATPGPAPRLGQHSREVLAEIGLSTSAIDALFASGSSREP